MGVAKELVSHMIERPMEGRRHSVRAACALTRSIRRHAFSGPACRSPFTPNRKSASFCSCGRELPAEKLTWNQACNTFREAAGESGSELDFTMNEKPKQDTMNKTTLQDLKDSLEEMHRFKAFLFELSAKFASLSLGEIDGEIENGLELIARFLDIDRAHLLEVKEDDPEAYITHAYAREGIPTYIGLKGGAQFPWAFQRIRQGKVVKYSRAEEEIKKPTKDREFVVREGIKSLLAIPLKVSGSIVGALSFTTFSSYRDWPDELIKDLNLVGEVFANAIQRKRAQEQIEALSRFEELVSEISARLVHLPASSVDNGIQEGLGRIGEFLGMDWCSLAQFSPYGSAVGVSHAWMRQGVDDSLGRLTTFELPWFIQKWLRSGVRGVRRRR